VEEVMQDVAGLIRDRATLVLVEKWVVGLILEMLGCSIITCDLRAAS
jgi:hypothetical protein